MQNYYYKYSEKSSNRSPDDNTLLIVFLSGVFFIKIDQNLEMSSNVLGMKVAIIYFKI